MTRRVGRVEHLYCPSTPTPRKWATRLHGGPARWRVTQPRELYPGVAFSRKKRTFAVSLFPCHGCQEKVPEKLATLYWAWVRADGSRVCYRQKLCVSCVSTRVLPFWVSVLADMFHCPSCHTPSEDDVDPIYVTLYAPGMPEDKQDWATCGVCAVAIRNAALERSTLMPDRNTGVEGPSHGPSTDARVAPWAAIGLYSRE